MRSRRSCVAHRAADQIATIAPTEPENGDGYTEAVELERVAALDCAARDAAVRVLILTRNGANALTRDSKT